MNKLVKGVYLIIGTLILVLLIYLLISYPNQIFVTLQVSPSWIPAIFLFPTGILITVFNGRLLRIIRSKKDKAFIAELLFGIFLFVGLIVILQGFLGIIIFSPIKLNLLFMQSIYIFMGGSLILLNIFVLEVYGGGINFKLNKLWAWIVILCASISIFGVVKNIFIGTNTYEAIFTSSPAVFCIFFVFLKFIISAFKTSKKMEGGIIHQSFELMGWGGLGFFIGVLLLGLGAIAKINESMGDSLEYLLLLIIVHFLILGGVSCIYLGFTRPIKGRVVISESKA